MCDLCNRVNFRQHMDGARVDHDMDDDRYDSFAALWIALRSKLSCMMEAGTNGGVKRHPQRVLKELAALAAIAERGAIALRLLDGTPEKGGPTDA